MPTLQIDPKLVTKFGIPQKDSTPSWQMLDGPVEALLRRWGAQDIYEAKNDGYRRFMVLRDGLWFYARANATSCYISKPFAWKASTGERAWTLREFDQLLDHLAGLVSKVLSTQDKVRILRESIEADEATK